MCLKSTYFSYGGKFNEQKEGAVMGSLVSAVVANLYTESFEELALEAVPTRPRLWKRYVDDTCINEEEGYIICYTVKVSQSYYSYFSCMCVVYTSGSSRNASKQVF